MVTLLASIAGFITSLIPEIIKYFKEQNEKKHELLLFDRQLKKIKYIESKSPEPLVSSSELSEQHTLYSTYKSGIDWVDSLNGSVRPVLAYSFFFMYCFVKFLQYKAITASAILIEYINVIWSIEDQAIFAGIISFYFGQRAFSKLFRK